MLQKNMCLECQEKYMAFFFFMNPGLRNSVKNLPKNKFKCLSQEFNQNSQSQQRKRIYPDKYVNRFESFDGIK